MAQPAVPVSDDRTDLAGLPPFWTKTSLSPPYSWDSWFGQFSLALGTKDNFNVSDIVVEPGDVHDDPLPDRSLGRTQRLNKNRMIAFEEMPPHDDGWKKQMQRGGRNARVSERIGYSLKQKQEQDPDCFSP